MRVREAPAPRLRRASHVEGRLGPAPGRDGLRLRQHRRFHVQDPRHRSQSRRGRPSPGLSSRVHWPHRHHDRLDGRHRSDGRRHDSRGDRHLRLREPTLVGQPASAIPIAPGAVLQQDQHQEGTGDRRGTLELGVLVRARRRGRHHQTSAVCLDPLRFGPVRSGLGQGRHRTLHGVRAFPSARLGGRHAVPPRGLDARPVVGGTRDPL